jgi:pilus assembly protein CpaB
VSIPITNATAVSGFISPGDRGDVVLAADLRKTDETERANHTDRLVRYAAETVLTDLRVLAIDQTIQRAKEDLQGKTATVEVTPAQAEILSAAGMMGTLQLVLRGLPAADDPSTARGPDNERAHFTTDMDASAALKAQVGLSRTGPKPPSGGGGGGATIQINRAGQITSERIGK